MPTTKCTVRVGDQGGERKAVILYSKQFFSYLVSYFQCFQESIVCLYKYYAIQSDMYVVEQKAERMLEPIAVYVFNVKCQTIHYTVPCITIFLFYHSSVNVAM